MKYLYLRNVRYKTDLVFTDKINLEVFTMPKKDVNHLLNVLADEDDEYLFLQVDI